ncbi:MAG TPA: N-formylglutamate amidohydrolase [Spirochaetota bacterium]|nr:N-formylglutamate amidohydrolase [Spirochaetota bacterium]
MNTDKYARHGMPRLNVAFESAHLSYSELPVDLYNSGVNQMLSIAAYCGHRIYHFSMADLYEHEGMSYVSASVLELPRGWSGPSLEAYRHLKKVKQQSIRVVDIHICITRGDDIRTWNTPNINILRGFENNGILLESVEATIATCDKYGLTERCPEVPQPVTFAAKNLPEALSAIEKLPHEEPWFVLKDRFGYGCGEQVHRLAFNDPYLSAQLHDYLSAYNSIILQEFCPEVKKGDIVVTFWENRMLGAMRRRSHKGQWKTNASLGATEKHHTLTPEQAATAWAVRQAFPDIRLTSVDLLPSGKAIEINAFPGGNGLLKTQDIELGNIVFTKLEHEIRKKMEGPLIAPPPVQGDEAPSLVGARAEIAPVYKKSNKKFQVYDVLSSEEHNMAIEDLIQFSPKSDNYILSIPHAGLFIPRKYVNHFTLDEKALLEIDLFSDIIFEGLDGMQIVSRLAPFFVDMNRRKKGFRKHSIPAHLQNPPDEYYSIDNTLFLKQNYTAKEKKEVLTFYDLYHDITENIIDRMKRERGYALVIDGHSMTSKGLGRVYDKGEKRDNFVVGTLRGSSADNQIIDAFVQTLKSESRPYGLGLSTARDRPYSGGFITRRHSDPDEDVHVIQIEVTMESYMYEATESNPKLRYALKPHRVRVVQKVIEQAISAACETAEKIYG